MGSEKMGGSNQRRIEPLLRTRTTRVSVSGLKRFARIFGLVAGAAPMCALALSVATGPAVAQEPAAAPPGHGTPLPAPAGNEAAGNEGDAKKGMTALEAKKAQVARMRQQRAN